jgi:hypothetical protein
MSRDIKKTVFSFILTTMIIAFLPLCVFSAAAATSMQEKGVTGLVSLGNARSVVLATLGKPDSAKETDYTFTRGVCKVLINFDEKTDLVESIIVLGICPKYTVRGVTSGSTKAEVRKVFGAPERSYYYKKSGVECWYYPSRNVSFSFKSGKVASFSVCECRY